MYVPENVRKLRLYAGLGLAFMLFGMICFTTWQVQSTNRSKFNTIAELSKQGYDSTEIRYVLGTKSTK